MLIFILLTALSPFSFAEPSAAPPAVFDDFAAEISSHIVRHDTSYDVFHGCVDWHSAVHGHWALFRLARVDGRFKPQALAAEADLTPEGLEKERAFLKANPYFEIPYGRSWFLRLAIEYEDWAQENGRPDAWRLRPMADEAAAALLKFYGQYPPTPQASEYANASWAFAQLSAYYAHTGDKEGLAAAQRVIRDDFLSQPGLSFGADAGSPEFFSLFGNWAYLIAKSQPPQDADKLLSAYPLTDAALRPVALLPDPHSPSATFNVAAHHLGMNWSRAWTLKALSALAPTPEEKKRLDDAYEAHVRQGLLDHARYASDYGRYGHWVPQFAVYALTEGSVKD